MTNTGNKTNKLVCFLHIEKCAGTTMNDILKNNYWNYYLDSPYIYEGFDNYQKFHLKSKELYLISKKIPKFKAFGGHSIRVYENYSNLLNKDVFYFTLFRNPLNRYISNYLYIKQNLKKNISFEEYLNNKYYNNFITKKICDEEDIDKALYIINKYNVFVGFTKHYDLSLLLMQKLLYSYGENFCINYEKRNVNKQNNKENIKKLKGTYNKEMLENNKIDILLYEKTYENFKKNIVYNNNFDIQLKEFKQNNKKFSFNKLKMKLIKRYKKIYINKLESFYRDISERKLSK